MPLFEYKCEKCEEKFERLLKHDERENPQRCPKCNAKHCKKMISVTSFALKGGGWAQDGYAG
jgi:putative FmdB family regulatory protein